MKRISILLVVALIGGALIGSSVSDAGTRSSRGERTKYLVLYKKGVTLRSARAAVRRAGGRIVRENRAVRLATVISRNDRFMTAILRQRAIAGAARNRTIGRSFLGQGKSDKIALAENQEEKKPGGKVRKNPAPDEPLAGLQWDMRQINATPQGSYAVQPGSKKVLVGIIDTGVDGSHPDLAPNFNTGLSRNFTTDIPLVDGECADDPDHSCQDPANVDEAGHGTHVAGSVAAARNSFGIAGVAPNVSLVNLRAGQDSGYFFLQPSVDALTYAADNGIDVVNMSYYIDPWLYNCANNPADSPAAQQEQRTIIASTNRALDYAHKRGVTLVGSLGNSNTDLGNPTFDDTSPDFPPDTAYEREVDNSCLNLPIEGHHVIGVSATGPSERKSWYSNWGVEQATVAAPGGDSFDAALPAPQHRVLSTYSFTAILQEEKDTEVDLIDDETGEPLTNRIIRQCAGSQCAYYRYLQGTSMAAPHATGVVALIVSQYGHKDGKNKGGLTLKPHQSKKILIRTARDHACPAGGVQEYPEIGDTFGPDSWVAFTAPCEGTTSFNGLYGHGIVDALRAVTKRS